MGCGGTSSSCGRVRIWKLASKRARLWRSRHGAPSARSASTRTHPSCGRDLVPPRARVFHETSDAFFARQTREEALGKHRVDFAFIDGMHWFESALRDFIFTSKLGRAFRDGVVALHDCLPIFPLTASRERRTKFWVGDVWKIVGILREYRPELRVKIVATAPSGAVHRAWPRSRFARALSERLAGNHRALCATCRTP